MTMREPRVAALLALLGLGIPAAGHAALVSADDPAFGVGALILDTATGLQFLRLPFTQNQSYTQVAGELGTAGPYADFRFATAQEVKILAADDGAFPASYAGEVSLVPLVGATVVTSTPQYSEEAAYGFTSTPGRIPGDDTVVIIAWSATPHPASSSSTGVAGVGYDGIVLFDSEPKSTTGYNSLASFLVRTNAATTVPEPATLALYGFALLLLGLARGGMRRGFHYGRNLFGISDAACVTC